MYGLVFWQSSSHNWGPQERQCWWREQSHLWLLELQDLRIPTSENWDVCAWSAPVLWTPEPICSIALLKAKHTDRNCPPWPATIATIYVSYFTTGGPGKEHGTNKPRPTGRVQKRSKGDAMCPTTSQNPKMSYHIHLGWAIHMPPGRTLSQNDWPKTTQKQIPSP